MLARYFRYLFQNTNEGLVLSGSIWDSNRDMLTNFVYIAGTGNINYRHHAENNGADEINYLILGLYSEPGLMLLLELLKTNRVHKVFLPYLAPVQRLVLAERMVASSGYDSGIMQFLQDPYKYIKSFFVENVYFISGNGRPLREYPEEMPEGCYFEAADTYELECVREMEGYPVPLLRAGYIIENRWLFYFGCIGQNVRELADFVRNASITDDADEVQMHQIIHSYGQQFADIRETGLLLYHGALDADNKRNNSMFTVRKFNSKSCGGGQITRDYKDCSIKCMHCNDHFILKHHLREKESKERYGTLLCSMLSLGRGWTFMKKRFEVARMYIRAVGLPSVIQKNTQIKPLLRWLEGEDTVFVVGNLKHGICAEFMKEVLLYPAAFELMNVDKDYGICFSGYLVEDDDY